VIGTDAIVHPFLATPSERLMDATVVGFAGMMHLGIVSAIAAAARGFSVIGYDSDESLVSRLGGHDLPILEPGLDRLLATNQDRIRFSATLGDLSGCDVVYIAADVPTDDEAHSDLTPISALVDRVSQHLRDDTVLVVLCQVPPGFTRTISRVPHDRLIYQVETLIFGRAVERALNPERFIVGCADPEKPLPPRYRELLDAFGCPILPMRYESAELAKISINFCLVASVTVANVLAELSESIGADWAEIVPALRLDRRIGPYSYLSPGLGIAGGNLERDLRTVLNLAEDRGTDVGVVHASIANSRHRRDWCWRVLQERVVSIKPTARVGVLGLAYKEHTDSTKNSPALALLGRLRGMDLRVHDPVVPTAIVPYTIGCSEPLACAEGADALVLATPWPQYRKLQIPDLARLMTGRVLIDPFRLLDGGEAAAAGFEYHALGMPALGPIVPGSRR
jgi:UDPglucose 6-dehydrogenase